MIVAGLLAFGLVFAMPVAGAFAVGVDAGGISDVKNAGIKPAYGQTWIGPWMKNSGWGAFDRDMITARDQGVTPVVMWYYWGDSISVDCVKYGCDGRSREGWASMMREMISHIKSTIGDRPVIIVMEPEFNKNGVAQWETFDGYLAEQEYAIKAALPNAKIAVGFGHWGGWDLFDRAAAAADYTGFQIMRGSTRDSSSQAVNAADEIIKISQTLKSRFGKPTIVFDYAIASYGGWEWAQEKSMQNVVAKRAQLDAAGVEILVWRFVKDNHYSSGYYGPAESTWGAKRADGSNKPVWDDLLNLLRGGSSSSQPPSPQPPASQPPSGGTAPSNAFSGIKGNEYWMQANVAGDAKSVTVSVNGRAPVAMQKQWWGGHTVSTHLGTNSVIELRATYADGSVASGKFNYPSGTPAGSGSSSGSTGGSTGGSSSGSFSNVKGNQWWMQANVAGSPTSVTVSVNGGSQKALAKQSWGAWTVSTNLGTGTVIELRATYSDGRVATAKYDWPTGGSAFDASFSNVKGNRYWVQANVDANQPLAGADVRVNGGTWVPMTKQSWGAWAKSVHVPAGAKVEIRARSTSGASEVSGATYWG